MSKGLKGCEMCIYNIGKDLCVSDILCVENSQFIPRYKYNIISDETRVTEINQEEKEMINHPSHYNQGKYEAVDVFKSITGEMTRLFEIKNKNYGNSFSKQFDEYGLTSVCIRLEDKLNRLKSLSKQGDNANADDESLRDTLIDLANYSVLSIMEIDKRK